MGRRQGHLWEWGDGPWPLFSASHRLSFLSLSFPPSLPAAPPVKGKRKQSEEGEALEPPASPKPDGAQSRSQSPIQLEVSSATPQGHFPATLSLGGLGASSALRRDPGPFASGEFWADRGLPSKEDGQDADREPGKRTVLSCKPAFPPTHHSSWHRVGARG